MLRRFRIGFRFSCRQPAVHQTQSVVGTVQYSTVQYTTWYSLPAHNGSPARNERYCVSAAAEAGGSVTAIVTATHQNIANTKLLATFLPVVYRLFSCWVETSCLGAWWLSGSMRRPSLYYADTLVCAGASSGGHGEERVLSRGGVAAQSVVRYCQNG